MVLGKANDFWCSCFNLFCPMETLITDDNSQNKEEVEKEAGKLIEVYMDESQLLTKNVSVRKDIEFVWFEGADGQNKAEERVFVDEFDIRPLEEYVWYDDDEEDKKVAKVAEVLESYPNIFM